MKNKDTSPGDREEKLANPPAVKVVEAVVEKLNLEPATLEEAKAMLAEARERAAVAEAARRSEELTAGGITKSRADKLKAMKVHAEDPAEAQRERAQKQQAAIKAKARVRGGLKQYTNPGEPAYRMGVYYPPNSLIELPPEEDPSVTWVAVTNADFKAGGVVVTDDDRFAMSQMQERNIKRAADVDVTA